MQERFEWLFGLVNRPEGQPSQLDDLMGQLQLVYQELNKMSFSGVASGGQSGQALLNFQQTASRMGGPLPRWATQISAGSRNYVRGHPGVNQCPLAVHRAAVLRAGAWEQVSVQPFGAG